MVNGPAFTSGGFEKFVKVNGIKHVKTAPYHPVSNGLVEQSVQIFKDGIKKLKDGSLETKVQTHTVDQTCLSPSELLFGRRIRCHLDFLSPNLAAKVRQCQSQQKDTHDYHACNREFQIGDRVFAKNYGAGESWLPGVIQNKTGPSSFIVDLTDGRRIRRHLDQMREDTTVVSDSASVTGTNDDDFPIPMPDQSQDEQLSTEPNNDDNTSQSGNRLRRSQCTIHPPAHYLPDND